MKQLNNTFFQYLVLSFLSIGLESCNNDDDPIRPTLEIPPVNLTNLNVVLIFGEELSPDQKNPAFEYIMSDPTDLVMATSSGRVETILLNNNVSDYEIRIRLEENPDWLVIHDHVLNLQVAEGDTVNAGTILGVVGMLNRTELQLNNGKGNSTIAHCAINYGSDHFILEHESIMANWCLEKTVIP